jgi:hypothetical protein
VVRLGVGTAGCTAAAIAAAAAAATAAATSGRERWTRRNFRDREVTLAGGPAVSLGAIVPLVAAGAWPAAVAGTSAAVLGLYDDIYGDSHARGLSGHVRALRHGRVTTGVVKLVGLVVGGAAASVVHRRSVGADVVVDAALVAGAANLVNLLDLRPGRALKATLLVTPVLARSDPTTAAVVAGAAGATLPADLAERLMIGDCGANAVGALLGCAAACGFGRVGRAATLVVVVGLTLASERVSFSATIARTPWLDAIDRWGRR